MKRISHSDDSAKSRRLLSTVYRSYPRIIYVIELAPEVAADPVFLSANPQYVAHASCFYVGSSSLSASQRYRDHLAGNNASIIAGKYAVKLRYDLMPEQKPTPRDRALREERRLARTLRAKGFGVWQK
jgi:predicted GIY-YIG superfamily endonuclease